MLTWTEDAALRHARLSERAEIARQLDYLRTLARTSPETVAKHLRSVEGNNTLELASTLLAPPAHLAARLHYQRYIKPLTFPLFVVVAVAITLSGVWKLTRMDRQRDARWLANVQGVCSASLALAKTRYDSLTTLRLPPPMPGVSDNGSCLYYLNVKVDP